MRKVLFTLSLLLTIHWGLQAQKTMQGTVVYNYSVSGEGSEMMASMLPEKMTVTYGNNAIMTTMEGGMMASMMGRMIVNDGEGYIIQDDKEIIYNMSEEDIANAETPTASDLEKIEGESREIMGYTCEAYRMKMTQNGQEMSQVIWATKALKAPKIKGAAAANMNQTFAGLGGLDAFPMEVEIELAAMPIKMVLSVSELKMEKPDPSVFAKPKGYEQKPFSDLIRSMRN
jgi:hypothetical protein